MKKRLYSLPRTKDEVNINDYNAVISYLWEGNIDIQFLSEKSFSVSAYVSKYCLKAEKSNLNFSIENTTGNNMTANQQFHKFVYSCLRQREMSAMEAADRILHNNGQMWRSSETFEWVPTVSPGHGRRRLMKKYKDLEGQDPNSTDVFIPDMIHVFYPNRPQCLDDMSLHDFVSTYERLYEKKGGDVLIRDPTTKKVLARFKKRDKQPIIYHHRYSHRTKPEKFYYSLLALHKPWRTEGDILGPSATYEAEFFRCIVDRSELKSRAEAIINIEQARETMEQRVNDDLTKGPESQQFSDGIDKDALIAFEASRSGAAVSSDELETIIQSLNIDQRSIFDLVVDKVNIDKQLLLYVSGFGGTGKSYVLKAITSYIRLHNKDVLLAGPTGLAAKNISGMTLHSIFNLLVEHGCQPKYSALKKPVLDQMRAVFKDLQCIIIDEISMVSNVLLLYVHFRLNEIFAPSGGQLFGGKHVIVFGDLLQLPPVMAQPPYVTLSEIEVNKLTNGLPQEINLWQHFEFKELTINQRQKGQENKLYSDLLGRLRLGSCIPDDFSMLNSRVIKLGGTSPEELRESLVDQYLSVAEIEPSVVCLLPKRSMVKDFNGAIMARNFPNAEKVEAVDEVEQSGRKNKKLERNIMDAVRKLDDEGDDRNTGALEKVLFLAPGVRCMLRQNLDVPNGLTNGTIGTIMNLQRDNGGVVDKLVVQFDGCKEPVTLRREKRKIMVFTNGYFYREQFPVTVCYSMTIHKSQGLSLKAAFVDIGLSIFEAGQVYVALSRVTSMAGLHIINLSPAKIFARKDALVVYKHMGSKPLLDSVRPGNQEPVEPGPGERIWYTTASSRLARNTIKSTISNMASKVKDKVKDKVKRTLKRPLPTTTKNPSKRCQSDVLNVTSDNLSCHIDAVFAITSRSSYFHNFTRIEIATIYSDLILPTAQLVAAGRVPSTLRCELSLQLNPDPFSVLSYTRYKWLSGSLMTRYIWYLQDTIQNLSMYSMGYGVEESYGIVGLNKSEEHFSQKRFCLKQYSLHGTAARYSRKGEIVKAGHPMDKDLVVVLGNPGNHWILVIVDNRPSKRCVLYFDSASKSIPNSLKKRRCQKYVAFIKKWCDYLPIKYGVCSTTGGIMDTATYKFTNLDGKSNQQDNSYDCGVFALSNLEQYLLGNRVNTVRARDMVGIRAQIMHRIYNHGINTGYIV